MGALSAMGGLSSLTGLLPLSAPPMQINNTITIDWTSTVLSVNRKAYSVNLYQALNPAIANAQAYKDAIDYLNPEMVRIHSLEMMKDSTTRPLGWVINPTLPSYAWDVAKITNALGNLAPGRTKMLSICRFPAAIADAQGKLLDGKTAEFAAFCVQLLQICNQANAGITHIQLLNELDTAYTGATAMATLGAIWNTVRDAIKSAFPTMVVGGHSFANIYNSVNVDAYLNVCKSKMDFFAYNAYTTSNPTGTTQQQIWNSAAYSMRDSAKNMKNKLTAQGVGPMPVYATEMGMLILGAYNALNVGAKRLVWEGLRLIHTANSDAKFCGAWNEADDWHGLHSSPSSGYVRRPSAHLYHLFNQHMLGLLFPIAITGDTVPVVNSTPVPCVSAMACQSNGKKAIAIVNRSELPRVVRFQHNGWMPNESSVLDVNLITSQGLQTTPIHYEDFAPGYAMPADSVALISVR